MLKLSTKRFFIALKLENHWASFQKVEHYK